MARPLRVEFEGALYHLTGRGNARQRIFADDKDRAKFVQLLIESLQRYDVALHGYVLMRNHYHLIAETRRANLGRWMHWLTTAYSVISTDAIVRWDIFFKEDTRASCNR